MIRRAFFALPGPMPVKVVLAIVILALFLVALFWVYDWMGANLVDTGGGIG